MATTCFICDAPVSEDEGAEVAITVRVKGTDETRQEEAVCCDACADRIEARGATLLDELPALRSFTAVHEDGSSVRYDREAPDARAGRPGGEG